MNPADETTKPGQCLAVLQFRGMTALASEQGEAESIVLEQGLPVDQARGDQWNFSIRQFEGKIMLLLNLFVTPAARPVKLDDHGLCFFDSNLVHPVFVAV